MQKTQTKTASNRWLLRSECSHGPVIAKTLAISIMLALLALVTGCNQSNTLVGGAGQGIDEGASISGLSGEAKSDNLNRSNDVPLFSTTVNEIAVDVNNAYIKGDSIRLGYTYQNSIGIKVIRQLALHASLLSMSVYDEHGFALFGHEFELLSDSSANFRVWSGRDQFILGMAAEHDSVTLLLSDGIRSTLISGSEKTWTAERGTLLSDAIADFAAFAVNNEDIATVEHLLADEEFIKYLFSEFGDHIKNSPRRTKLCAVSALACTVCGFLWWCAPCWIPCVPACGIALACAIADLFG